MKSKKSSNIGILYLRAYNLLQTIGWSYILYKLLTNDYSSTIEANLWQNIKWPVIIFQHAALLEVIHAATGLVNAKPMITLIQVLSRVFVVSCVILATPYNYAASSFALPMMILAWCISEINRYIFYGLNLFGLNPYFVKWLRYTLFYILYPIGVSGELICTYSAVKYTNSHPEAWSYRLPNSWNFIFSYQILLITVMLSYIPFFPQTYMHMIAQRRKNVGSDALKKAK
ncbi:very-long-chain (3R)-3-hydroxyacyl-CoA dehydratase hpo-8 [Apis cerana]|uniref:Very-long-chain (3R)-3-hydroxyacyl-CoA dehydratase n=1 Tax=Apis cerana cerana TaxID=94128 RepID=A0A2A3ECX2_APICC|nr:very-long-chain (3R)-3-hydroxyacyl-CoA dehydratase hpo-8 [Apis cerana]PBC29568.1 Protein-tyrosine phosphatase member B [Apis cerana cerana]